MHVVNVQESDLCADELRDRSYHFVIAVWRAKEAELNRVKFWQTTLAMWQWYSLKTEKVADTNRCA